MSAVSVAGAASNSCADADSTSTSEPPVKSFYGSTTPQPSRPPTNNVRVYNGGAPVGFVDTPSNIHPIASLTPYQNRFNTQLSASYNNKNNSSNKK